MQNFKTLGQSKGRRKKVRKRNNVDSLVRQVETECGIQKKFPNVPTTQSTIQPSKAAWSVSPVTTQKKHLLKTNRQTDRPSWLDIDRCIKIRIKADVLYTTRNKKRKFFASVNGGSLLPGPRTQEALLSPPLTIAEIFQHTCLQNRLHTSPPTAWKSYRYPNLKNFKKKL